MNATQITRNNEFISDNMSKPAAYSIIFHVAVFVLATIGIPYIAKDSIPVQETPITVELVDLAEVSQTNVEDKPEDSEVEDVPLKRKPVYNKSESMPELDSPREPLVEDIDIPEPPKDKKEPDITEIKTPPKPKNKPRKPEPPKPKAEEPEKVEDKNDFNNLLKSLTPEEPEDTANQKVTETPDAQGQRSQVADYAQQMTRSEIDDLNRGVQPCWNVNAGGKNAEDLLVTLRVFVNPDMSVQQVQILDQLRYNSDTHFRAAADAARRALLNPNCSTLRLPPEKYEQWKVFKYTFDPSQML